MSLASRFRRFRPNRFLLGFAVCVFLIAGAASLHAAGPPSEREVAAMDRLSKWKIINFCIFAGGLGYFLARYAPRFFNARSSDIQKAIQDATGLKLEADYRYSEMDRKMATLADEVRRMREQAQGELEREHERFRAESRAEIEHIHQNVVNEVDALRRQGANQVRRHTAQLALAVAERRLQDRFSGPERDENIQDFVHLVERSKN